MILVLRQYGAYYEDIGGDGDWNIRVREKMSHYDADTLQALHGAVEDHLLGHRRFF